MITMREGGRCRHEEVGWRAAVAIVLVGVALARPCCAHVHRGGDAQRIPANASNVVLVIVDNMRPDLGAYGVENVLTPNMDQLLGESMLFSRAFCQLSWCAPSRNSFLTGRVPDDTRAWNFVDHFREGAGAAWVSLPQYFKESGYFTSSSGKVFHPDLPPNFDYPKSWTTVPYLPVKLPCPNNTMSCALDPALRVQDLAQAGFPQPAMATNSRHGLWVDVDMLTTQHALQQLGEWEVHGKPSGQPFFLAVGYQSPRLPWVFPAPILERYEGIDIPLPKHRFPVPTPANSSALEWFRPNEVDMYSDIHNVTHDTPMDDAKQKEVRLAYYASITHVDDQLGLLMAALNDSGVLATTNVVFMVDHGQTLGEHNLWSMMSTMETSLRVPFAISTPATRATARRHRLLQSAQSNTTRHHQRQHQNKHQEKKGRTQPAELLYQHPIELVDLYPTLASLSGLPAPPAGYNLSGVDLTPVLTNASLQLKDAAFGQITRCHNCTEAYANTFAKCSYDEAADRQYTVPCCMTNRTRFDYMGMSIRTQDWRFTVYCRWIGTTLTADWEDCPTRELYDHRTDTALYNIDDVENINVAYEPQHRAVVAELFERVKAKFTRGQESS